MIISKDELRVVEYQLTLTEREMSVLAAVAYNTAGRGDARFLYDISAQAEDDADIDTSDIEVSFTDFGCGPAFIGMVIETGVEE